jgi:hypothetical protein
MGQLLPRQSPDNGGIASRWLWLAITFLLTLLVGCRSSQQMDFSLPCTERGALLCEDFEGGAGELGASQLVRASLLAPWYITADTEQAYLFQDFPQTGRTRSHMIQLGDGSYPNQTSALLYTAEIDLTRSREAALTYNLIYRTEEHWDGLVVFAIRGGELGMDDPANWQALAPDDGYPDTVLFNGTIIPGYSGQAPGWRHESIDLSHMAGGPVVLGFYFVSDAYQEGWGVALDDIAVFTDTAGITGFSSSLFDISRVDLRFSQDPLVSAVIPRANAIKDTNCEGSPDPLRGGSRAYVKGSNQDGGRVLVLHPGNSQFCWVDEEDIWIDGDQAGIPRISDLKPEDSYLPVCPSSFSPVLEDPSCLADGTMVGEGSQFYPLWIEGLLVKEGSITVAVLSPQTLTPTEEKSTDPRTSREELLGISDFKLPRGGLLQVETNGISQPCLVASDGSGRVACGGLMLDAAGPIELKLCWQTWGIKQACPLGYAADRTTAACYPVDFLGSCQITCPPGYQYDQLSGSCDRSQNSADYEINNELCPAGFSILSAAGCCAATQQEVDGLCPAGYYYQPEGSHCLPASPQGSCPDRYVLDPVNNNCNPGPLLGQQICTTVELEIPRPVVTVRQSTRCYQLPDRGAEVISSLKPFTELEVLGSDPLRGYLLIDNPLYQVSCWVPLEDLYTDMIDPGTLPVFPAE